MSEPLTDDQIARLREVASTEGPGHMYAAWRQLNAVLNEIDRLREERDAAVLTAEEGAESVADLKAERDLLGRQRDQLYGRLAPLAETVRAEADVLQQDGRLRGALVLRDACDKAEAS